MPRKLVPQKAKIVRHQKLGIEVQIWYDRNNFTHYAEYNGAEYRDKDIAEVERAVYKAIEESAQLTWVPIIAVSEHRPFGNGYDPMQYISLELRRFWLAKMPGGPRYRQLNWVDRELRHYQVAELDPELPKAPSGVEALRWAKDFYWPDRDGPFAPPCMRKGNVGGDYDTRYFDYSGDLWMGLQALRSQIRGLRKNLDQLLAPAGGGAQLALIGREAIAHIEAQKLLAPPQSIEVAPAAPTVGKTEYVHFTVDPDWIAEMMGVPLGQPSLRAMNQAADHAAALDALWEDEE